VAQPTDPARADYPKWGVLDFLKWKLLPDRWGGGWPAVRAYKDGYVSYHRAEIRRIAKNQVIPVELLAATAWIEAGGDPTIVDTVAFELRAFDWSGPAWVDRNLTITNPPDRTSMGTVSIQLRRAAESMGLNPQTMNTEELRQLAEKLEQDVTNLAIVARHLHDLIRVDFPKIPTHTLTEEQIRIVGARYNRGPNLSLEAIQKNTSYGDTILKIWPRMTRLLSD
jgi:hypothetical protein